MHDAVEPDVVRLTIPADGDLQPVVEAAIAVLARRVRLSDDAVLAARLTAAAVLEEVAVGVGTAPLEVVIQVASDHLVMRVSGADGARVVTIPESAA